MWRGQDYVTGLWFFLLDHGMIKIPNDWDSQNGWDSQNDWESQNDWLFQSDWDSQNDWHFKRDWESLNGDFPLDKDSQVVR